MTRIIPVGGGKGGIGKSFVTANLGVLLAGTGMQVVLVDLDLGGSNLHTFFGLEQVKVGIGDFLDRSVRRLEQVVMPTRVANLSLVASCGSSFEIANLPYAQKRKTIDGVRKLPYDYVLLDLGAGTSFNTLDFFLAANEGLFICTPEPTSIENAFRFVKAVYLRKLKQLIKSHAFNAAVRKAAEEVKEGQSSPDDLIEMVLRYDPEKKPFLQQELARLNFHLVLNQVHHRVDPTLGYRICKVCNRHLYSTFGFLGNINYDEKVRKAILSKRPYIEQYPQTLTSVDLKNIAEKLSTSVRGSPSGGSHETASRPDTLRGAGRNTKRFSP